MSFLCQRDWASIQPSIEVFIWNAPLKAHMLKAWSPTWLYWEIEETLLNGGTWQEGFRWSESKSLEAIVGLGN